MPAVLDSAVAPPLASVLTESVDAVRTREARALEDLLSAHKHRCVLYGAGTLGRKAAGLLGEIDCAPMAFVDANPRLWGTHVCGIPVLSAQEAARQFGPDSVFFVTVWNDFHWYRDTHAKLIDLGCAFISSYAPIFWRFGSRFMDLLLLNEPPSRLYQHLDEVLSAEQIWGDEESLITYRANILWRAMGDAMYFPFPAPQNTYFPPDLFRLSTHEAFVDCGAFDGDSIRLLLSLTGSKFETIYAIEADHISARKLRDYISTLPNYIASRVHELPFAVGRERTTVHFVMSGAATASAVHDKPDSVEVQCFPMDDLFAGKPVTFIKMDIEGAEFEALQGAQRTIRDNAPILAVCVYHTQSDIWRIPLFLRSLIPDYSFFLRAYDGDGFQSVLYAVPPNRMFSDSGRESATLPRKPSVI